DASDQREAAGVDLHALGHVDVRASKEGEGPDRHDVRIDLGVAQIEIGAAEEGEDERAARNAPPPSALDAAEDRDSEALRRPPRPRRRLGRKLAERLLELARRPRAIGLVETLRQRFERQPTLGAVLTECDGGALPLRVGDAEIELLAHVSSNLYRPSTSAASSSTATRP